MSETQRRYSVTITNTYEVWADDETHAKTYAVQFDEIQKSEGHVQFTDSDIQVEELTTRFLVEYTVNLHHSVEINALDEEHAQELFEEMYNTRNDSMPEYYDISHDVVSVEPTAMQ
jgi:hypothetical protein